MLLARVLICVTVVPICDLDVLLYCEICGIRLQLLRERLRCTEQRLALAVEEGEFASVCSALLKFCSVAVRPVPESLSMLSICAAWVAKVLKLE